MGNLTKNIDTTELYCKCGKCKFSKSFSEEISWMMNTAKQLQKFRDWINKILDTENEIAIIIHCGIRCPNHNTIIGGEKHSRHLPKFYELGLGAADFHCTNISIKKLRKYFKIAWQVKIITGGAGLYSWGVHSDTSSRRFWGRFWGKP